MPPLDVTQLEDCTPPGSAGSSSSFAPALVRTHPARLEPLAQAIEAAVASSRRGPEALDALARLLDANLARIRQELAARQFQPRPPLRSRDNAPAGLTPAANAASFPACSLASRFQLTPAEARVAAHLAAGRSLREVAESTGVRPSTLRSHLQAVFDKTGVRRQSALVGLVLRDGGGVD